MIVLWLLISSSETLYFRIYGLFSSISNVRVFVFALLTLFHFFTGKQTKFWRPDLRILFHFSQISQKYIDINETSTNPFSSVFFWILFHCNFWHFFLHQVFKVHTAKSLRHPVFIVPSQKQIIENFLVIIFF